MSNNIVQFNEEIIKGQIIETDDTFIIYVCLTSEYEENPTTTFYLLDMYAKDSGYSSDVVDALVQTQDYILYAVKTMLIQSQFKVKCNASMSGELAKEAREEKNTKRKPQAEPMKLSEKPFLTIEEMAKYSGIGEKKLAWIIENYVSYENNFVVKIGTKNLFKREAFIEFVNKTDSL